VSTLRRNVSLLVNSFSEQWQNASGEFPRFGERYSREHQLQAEADVRRKLLADMPSQTDASVNSFPHMQRLKASMRGFVVHSFAPEDREEAAEMLRQFSRTGDEFVREAGEFDPDLHPVDIFQALRNLWIMNSLQVAFALPVSLNRSGFAYSLLYPYTDNYLDDPTAPESEKKAFNRNLARRLAGHQGSVASQFAAKVSALVEMIESEYPRISYPGVYESLLAIHRAQEKSILQNASRVCCTEDEILHISVEKGGTSVLADAYIAKGCLSLEEVQFAFGYGVFLQLMDDLQDVTEDLDNGYRTISTLSARKGSLDRVANRLVAFLYKVLDSAFLCPLPRTALLTELIRKSCRGLILESIALRPELYSNDYVESVEQHSLLRFGFIRDIHQEMMSKRIRCGKAFRKGSYQV
jgi:hypothetical protein